MRAALKIDVLDMREKSDAEPATLSWNAPVFRVGPADAMLWWRTEEAAWSAWDAAVGGGEGAERDGLIAAVPGKKCR